jgi:hypothetical protein
MRMSGVITRGSRGESVDGEVVWAIVRERCKLGSLRNDLSRARQHIPLCFQYIDLGCITSDRIGWPWVLLSRTGTGSEKRSHDVRRNLMVYDQPEQTYDNFHESSLLHLAFDISDWKAAADPECFAYVWFGNVPTLYLPLLHETWDWDRGVHLLNSQVTPHSPSLWGIPPARDDPWSIFRATVSLASATRRTNDDRRRDTHVTLSVRVRPWEGHSDLNIPAELVQTLQHPAAIRQSMVMR